MLVPAPPQHVAIIANPASGRGRGASVLAEATARLRHQGCAVQVFETTAPGHAVELARGLPAKLDLLLMIGGDGTTRDVVEGLGEREVPVGILPAGTGNDLIRTLGIPRDLDGALAIALHGRERRLDIWSWNGVPFVNVAGIGLDAAVADAVNRRFKWLGGTGAYVLAFLSVFPRFRPLSLRLTWMDGTWEGDAWEGGAWLAAFGNAVCYGGGMRIVPDAVPDDGLLDIVVVEDVPRATLLQQFPRLFSGEHVKHPRVRRIRASEIRVELLDAQGAFATATIDGELIAQAPAVIRRMPSSLRVRVPI